MSRLAQLYQETILDHNKRPRCFCEMDNASHQAHGKNPLCGDDYWVYVRVEGEQVSDLSFMGSGCAISKSSGSLMADTLKGKSVADVLAVKDAFLALLTDDAVLAEQSALLGKLKVFEGVKQYPARVKCAALVWRALEAALSDGEAVSTE